MVFVSLTEALPLTRRRGGALTLNATPWPRERIYRGEADNGAGPGVRRMLAGAGEPRHFWVDPSMPADHRARRGVALHRSVDKYSDIRDNSPEVARTYRDRVRPLPNASVWHSCGIRQRSASAGQRCRRRWPAGLVSARLTGAIPRPQTRTALGTSARCDRARSGFLHPPGPTAARAPRRER